MASALRRQQRFDRTDHVADRAHRLELFRLDTAAGHFLQFDREVDSVDAVEIEVFEQMRFGRHALRLDREVLFEDGADALKNLCLGHDLLPFSSGFVRSVRRFALARNQRGQRADRAEMLARAFVVRRDGQLVVFAQHDADFERVDRVETDAVGIEQRRIVVDIGRAQVFQIECLDQKLFNFQF